MFWQLFFENVLNPVIFMFLYIAFLKVVKMLSIVICQNRFLLVKNRHYIINIIYLYIVSKMTNPILILTNDNWQDLTISVFRIKSASLYLLFFNVLSLRELYWLSRQRAADSLHHRPAPSPLPLNNVYFKGEKGGISEKKMVFLRAENNEKTSIMPKILWNSSFASDAVGIWQW